MGTTTSDTCVILRVPRGYDSYIKKGKTTATRQDYPDPWTQLTDRQRASGINHPADPLPRRSRPLLYLNKPPNRPARRLPRPQFKYSFSAIDRKLDQIIKSLPPSLKYNKNKNKNKNCENLLRNLCGDKIFFLFLFLFCLCGILVVQ